MHKLSIVKQTVKNVLANVAADKFKTFLTCLGIMIGTAALICMMTNYAIDCRISDEDLKADGTYYVDITLYDGVTHFTEDDLDNIRQMDHAAGMSPVVSVSCSVRNGNISEKSAGIDGIAPDYIDVGQCISIISGRGISDKDVADRKYVCIINRPLAKKLYGTSDPVGQQMRIDGLLFKVIGISTKKNETSWDKNIYIPYTVAEMISGYAVSEIMVYPDSVADSVELDSNVREYVLDRTKSSDAYYDGYWGEFVEDDKKQEALKQVQQYLVAFLTMLIGGIGIMNMMHVMVTERTVEIGLRKALGATPARIQTQFVAEAVVISLLGGISGVLLGIIGSVIICVLRSQSFIINPFSIVISLAFSMAVGILFGWLPAKSASRLNVIDALKSE